MSRLTSYQRRIIFKLVYGSLMGYSKNKKGEYSHWIVGRDGVKERIRSDTSKSIRRWFNQKINHKIKIR